MALAVKRLGIHVRETSDFSHTITAFVGSCVGGFQTAAQDCKAIESVLERPPVGGEVVGMERRHLSWQRGLLMRIYMSD
jgi:hypothetical protein